MNLAVTTRDSQGCVIVGRSPKSTQQLAAGTYALKIVISSDDEQSVPLEEEILLRCIDATPTQGNSMRDLFLIELTQYVPGHTNLPSDPEGAFCAMEVLDG